MFKLSQEITDQKRLPPPENIHIYLEHWAKLSGKIVLIPHLPQLYLGTLPLKKNSILHILTILHNLCCSENLSHIKQIYICLPSLKIYICLHTLSPPYILAHVSLWSVKLNCSDQVFTFCTAWR